MGSLTYSAPTQKRTGVYGEPWQEGRLGSCQITIDNVDHIYEQDPDADGNHWHARDGERLEYGFHTHDRWREPHRHLHPGDAKPSEGRGHYVGGSAGVRDDERMPTHHSHREYVLAAIDLQGAIESALRAARLGVAAYEDGRFRDAQQAYSDLARFAGVMVAKATTIAAAVQTLANDSLRSNQPVECEPQTRKLRKAA